MKIKNDSIWVCFSLSKREIGLMCRRMSPASAKKKIHNYLDSQGVPYPTKIHTFYSVGFFIIILLDCRGINERKATMKRIIKNFIKTNSMLGYTPPLYAGDATRIKRDNEKAKKEYESKYYHAESHGYKFRIN